MKQNRPALVFRLLPLVGLLACPAAAKAQTVFGGGGRITIGAPTDFSVSTGHGNYPGGGGFVPGYGYYPYYVNDGERAPSIVIRVYPKHAAPDLPPPPALAFEPPPDAAVLNLRVPPDAAVWFDGAPTAQRGEQRRFVTPPLPPGSASVYEVRVRWAEGGKPAGRTEQVRVYPGDRRTLGYTARPADEFPVLAPPRRVP